MSTKIKLLNNQGDVVTIEHSDTASAQGNSVINIKDVTKQVDTIADLKALDGTHKLVYVTGYHTKGDGAFGSHFFEWDATSTEADNDGTIIALTSVATGRYKLKYDCAVNVKWFGAKGDNQTDDTIAIQKALEVNYNIYVPAGTYIVSNLDVTKFSNTYIKGEGIGKSIFKTLANNSNDTILIAGNINGTWGSGGELYIEHMSFMGYKSGWDTFNNSISTKGLIEVYNTSRLKLNDVQVTTSANSGIYINNTGYSSITNCILSSCKMDCIYLNSTSSSDAVTTTYITKSQINTGLQSSVHLNNVFNVVIEKCQLEDSNTALLIDGTSNRSITFRDNYVENTQGDYDITAGNANGIKFAFFNNYLFGTPSISSLQQPSNPEQNFSPLFWWNNQGEKNPPETTNVIDLEQFKGMISSEGNSTFTAAYAKNAAQQEATIEARTENGFGVGLRGDSVLGGYILGLLRNSNFDNIDDRQAYFSQTYDNRGAINTSPTDAFALHIFGGSGTSGAQNCLKCSHVGGTVLETGGLGYTMTGTPNSSSAALYLYQPNTTGRSLNASGTINASGADYAEYMLKDGDFTIKKGDICGITKDGKLTNLYNKSIAFVAKSSFPSYVGNDKLYTDLLSQLGKPPKKPEKNDNDEYKKYLKLKKIYEEKKEEIRKKVDRISFCGQIVVNVYNASVGSYIVPKNDNNKIIGVPVKNPTLEEYMQSIGKVISIEPDGRCKIIVKVV